MDTPNGRPARHPLLEQLARDRVGLRTTFHVDLRGMRFDFELLGPEADGWVGTFTPAVNLVAWSFESRKYRFAAALRSMTALEGTDTNDADTCVGVTPWTVGSTVSVEKLWPLPEDAAARAAIEGSDEVDPRIRARNVRSWRRLQVVQYIEDGNVDSYDLRAFENEYSVHNEKRQAAFRGAEPGSFTTGTPSPGSEAMSSPEKAS